MGIFKMKKDITEFFVPPMFNKKEKKYNILWRSFSIKETKSFLLGNLS